MCLLLVPVLIGSFFAADIMENLMVIRVEVIAPEKPLLSKHL